MTTTPTTTDRFQTSELVGPTGHGDCLAWRGPIGTFFANQTSTGAVLVGVLLPADFGGVLVTAATQGF